MINAEKRCFSSPLQPVLRVRAAGCHSSLGYGLKVKEEEKEKAAATCLFMAHSENYDITTSTTSTTLPLFSSLGFGALAKLANSFTATSYERLLKTNK